MLRVDGFIPARPGAGGLEINLYSKASASASSEIAGRRFQTHAAAAEASTEKQEKRGIPTKADGEGCRAASPGVAGLRPLQRKCRERWLTLRDRGRQLAAPEVMGRLYICDESTTVVERAFWMDITILFTVAYRHAMVCFAARDV